MIQPRANRGMSIFEDLRATCRHTCRWCILTIFGNLHRYKCASIELAFRHFFQRFIIIKNKLLRLTWKCDSSWLWARVWIPRWQFKCAEWNRERRKTDVGFFFRRLNIKTFYNPAIWYNKHHCASSQALERTDCRYISATCRFYIIWRFCWF